MRNLLTFKELSSEWQKVLFFSTGNNWNLPEECAIFKYIHSEKDYEAATTRIDMPVLLYDWKADKEKFSINNAGTFYNMLTNCYIGKLDILKKMISDNSKWIPKTVFSAKDASSLGFPLIAKKKDSYDSKGVEAVKNEQDLQKYSDYDIFQKAINIQREFRVVLFRGKVNNPTAKILMILEKEPKNKKANRLRVYESEGNTKFYWIHLDPYKFEFMEDVKSLSKYVLDLNPSLNVIGLDVAVDDKNKVWFIEHNILSSMLSNQAALVYKHIYEDFFNTKMLGTDKLIELSEALFKISAGKYPFKMENDKVLTYLDGISI